MLAVWLTHRPYNKVNHHHFILSSHRTLAALNPPVCSISCLRSALSQTGSCHALDAVHSSVLLSSPFSLSFHLTFKKGLQYSITPTIDGKSEKSYRVWRPCSPPSPFFFLIWDKIQIEVGMGALGPDLALHTKQSLFASFTFRTASLATIGGNALWTFWSPFKKQNKNIPYNMYCKTTVKYFLIHLWEILKLKLRDYFGKA